MEFIAINDNLSRISHQLSILQDYITLKFGLDFELYYKNRTEPVEDLHHNDDIHQSCRRVTASTPKARRGRKSNSSRSSAATHLTRLTSQHAQVKVPRHSPNVSVNPPTPTQEFDIQNVKTELATEDDFFDELDGFSEPENFGDLEKAEMAQGYNSENVGDFNDDDDSVNTFHGNDILETKTDTDMNSGSVEAGTSRVDKRKKSPSAPPSTHPNAGAALKSGRLPFILHGKYFKLVEQQGIRVTAECQTCPTPRLINGSLCSTTNFLTHLKRVHPSTLEDYHISRKQEQDMRKVLLKKQKPHRLKLNTIQPKRYHLDPNGRLPQSQISLPSEFQPSEPLTSNQSVLVFPPQLPTHLDQNLTSSLS